MIWSVLGFALVLERWPLMALVGLSRAFPIYGGFSLIGAALTLACLVAAFRTRGSLIAAAGFIVVGSALLLGVAPLSDAGAFLKFLALRSEYAMAVEAAKNGADGDGAMVAVESGPPFRVRFTWVRQVSIWHGVIYDETGTIGRGGAGSAAPSCRSFGKPYYFCHIR